MTLARVFKDFAATFLSAGIDSSQTSITVVDGTRLQDPASGQIAEAVIHNYTDYPDPSSDPDRELVDITDVTSNTVTVATRTGGKSHNDALKKYRIAIVATADFLNTLPQLRTDGVVEMPASANSPARLRMERLSGDTADVDPQVTLIDTPNSKTYGIGIDVSAGTLRITPSATLASTTGLHLTSTGAFMMNTASQSGVLHVSGSASSCIVLNQTTAAGTVKLQMNVEGTERGYISVNATGSVMRIDSDYELWLAAANTHCIKIGTALDTYIRIEDDESESGPMFYGTGYGSMSFYHLEGTPDRLCIKVVTQSGNTRYAEISLSATAPT